MSRINQPAEGPAELGVMPGNWWHAVAGDRIVCDLCPRACALRPGDRGFCFVRENRAGEMVLTTYGRSTGFCIDPIEKKPLHHFYPGTSVLSFGTAGCNLGCKFCQNWSISKSREVEQLSELALPDAIVRAAIHHGCQSVAFTYNDPVVWAEYAIDVAKACRAHGIQTVAVTAGYITSQARAPFFEWMDAANVDLKGFTEDFYQHLTLSHLEPVLETLRWLKRETEVWFEITNLVIPQANDAAHDLQQMCDWILENLGDDIPVHFTAFHPDFRLRDRGPTPIETLLQAHAIASERGLKYAYVGNVHDQVHQSTYCPQCGTLLIARDWYQLGKYHMKRNRCGECGQRITGRFADRPGTWGRQRLPVRMSRFARPTGVEASAQMPDNGRGQSEGSRIMVTAISANDPPTGEHSLSGLTETHLAVIHRHAAQLVAAAATGCSVEISDPQFSQVAAVQVWGCFVTIKRGAQLRGCCGNIGRMAPVAVLLRESAIASATRDTRMPPLSPSELPQIDVTVSLLHNIQPIAAHGLQRSQHVVIGRHGLQIVRGSSRGLLLPAVASEHVFTSEQFLRHVCIKAGLPVTAWHDQDAEIYTFEAMTVAGPLPAELIGSVPLVRPSLLSAEQLQRLTQFCRKNVLALLRGATPDVYLFDCPDGTVQGIDVRLNWPGRPRAWHGGRLSLRPGIPLQATLADLAQSAARELHEHQFLPTRSEELELDLAILEDIAVHGPLADSDLTGLDSKCRAILVMETGNTAWIFDPRSPPAELLERVTARAQVFDRPAAHVASAAASATRVPYEVHYRTQGIRGPEVRPAAVAGTFYPESPTELAQLVDGLLPSASSIARRPWPAALVPHAGLRYSGHVAAQVLAHIDFPDTVIILGPKHTRAGVTWGVAPQPTWSIPGAEIANDLELAQALVSAIGGLQFDAAAHAQEHAIEVELPFIARLAPHARVVGVAIGGGTFERCQEFATGLASVLRRRERTLLLISSDMNHFANDEDTRRLDALALDSLKTMRAAEAYRVIHEHQISMCGVLPAVIVIETLCQLEQLQRVEQVAYATSADVSGDTSRAVGYAGLLLGPLDI